jgi:RND family efflux transporter MFP subunit
MEIAKLNLKRTKIRAPFNGRVKKKKVDIGQFVSPGMVMAVLYDTEKAIVTVPLQKEEMELLDLENGYNNSSKNSVTIYSNFGLKEYSWYGRYVRDEAEFNQSNRLLNIIIEVNKPYSAEWEKPLRPGMYVTVRLKGKQLQDVYKIPRDFFYNESLLKVYNNGTLELREVKSILVNKDYVYISQGLNKDDLVITSRMDYVVEGMKVKIGEQ